MRNSLGFFYYCICYQNSAHINYCNVSDKAMSILCCGCRSVLCLHFSSALLVKSLYECSKVNYCYIFKVPEVPKKIVVEEKVHVPEEPKVAPAKGICLPLLIHC